MANEDSLLLKEVDQELAEERQWAMFRKHGLSAIAAAIAVVVGVGAWQGWEHYQTSTAEAHALEFRNAVELLAEDQVTGRAALEAVAAEKGGYGVLAALQQAGSYAAGGERLKALEIYRGIAKGDAPRRVRELAQLRAAYLSLADGRDAVMADLGGLTESESYFGFYAREVLGVAALYAEDYEAALSNFRQLSIDLEAPAGVRERAEEFAALAASAKAGVNITGEVHLDDLAKAVGAPQDAAASGEAAPENMVAPEAGDALPQQPAQQLAAPDAAPASDENDMGSDDHNDHNNEE